MRSGRLLGCFDINLAIMVMIMIIIKAVNKIPSALHLAVSSFFFPPSFLRDSTTSNDDEEGEEGGKQLKI